MIHGETEIELTYTEFEILLLLAQNAGIVFSKEQIYDCVWKEPYFGDYNIVMSHIRNLREKIEDSPSKGAVLLILWMTMFLSDSSIYTRRCMGILAPSFVILILPELWKNRSNGAMEVEGATFFSIKNIYAARMLLFGMVDVCLV